MQDTFMKMRAQIGSLAQLESFRSWLFRIARNECLMILRKLRPLQLLDTELIDGGGIRRTPFRSYLAIDSLRLATRLGLRSVVTGL